MGLREFAQRTDQKQSLTGRGSLAALLTRLQKTVTMPRLGLVEPSQGQEMGYEATARIQEGEQTGPPSRVVVATGEGEDKERD